MQIAVTSQNRKTITEHAGKCRKFWIYDIDKGVVVGKRLVEVSMEQTLHASHQQLAEPLAGINVVITGSMGPSLYDRLMQSGILPVITMDEDPDAAVAALLSNTPVSYTHLDVYKRQKEDSGVQWFQSIIMATP